MKQISETARSLVAAGVADAHSQYYGTSWASADLLVRSDPDLKVLVEKIASMAPPSRKGRLLRVFSSSWSASEFVEIDKAAWRTS